MELIPIYILFLYPMMLQHEKADVIQEVIERLEKEFTIQFTKDTAKSENNKALEDWIDGVSDTLKSIKQFKAEVDVLALQEAESYATDVNEDKEIKAGTHLDKEAERGNIIDTTPKELWNNEETIKVWVSDDCYYETTPAQMQRDDYRRP